MRSILLSILLLIALIFTGCSGNEGKSTQQAGDSVKLTKEKFPAGEITEIKIKQDTALSYALYLPSGYSNDSTYPLMYAFDPSGSGKIPLNLYKELADKYGYILVGSNNSKNGMTWQETKIVTEKLFVDVQSRLPVNLQRIYLLGFSGGARVAHGLAGITGMVNGVIACGAAAPAGGTKNPRKNFTFIALIGDKDLNYSEVKKYDLLEMTDHQAKHMLITFDGKHEWPSASVMNEGMLWMELNEMRKTPSYKKESMISASFDSIPKQLDLLLKEGKNYEAFLLTKKTINFYEGLANLAPFYDAYKKLGIDPEINQRLKGEERIWKKEESLKQEYAKPAETESVEWWKKEVSSLGQKIRTEKNRDEALVYERILEYLSLYMYSQVNNSLSQNNFDAAERYSKIYVTVDPDNSEAWYLSARIAAMKSDGTRALQFLKKAEEHGFKDKSRLDSDVVFSTIRNSVEFRELEKRMD